MTKATDQRAARSYAQLTRAHLRRLGDLAEGHHNEFEARYPRWAAGPLASCLVQGGARHFCHGDRGVKDLDVYVFYALPPGANAAHFPWNRHNPSVDFGPSSLGRNLYTDEERVRPTIARRLPDLERFQGRRVDLMSRAIAPHPEGARPAIRSWLERGASKRRQHPDAPMDTDWHLARCPVVCLWPDLGAIWWDGPSDDAPGQEKGAYD